MKFWNYENKNDTAFNWEAPYNTLEPLSKADTIYEDDFQTGDILIYKNINDYLYQSNSGKLSIRQYVTYENGEYAYIYIEGKGFVGVNNGNGKVNGHSSARNEFNAKYYKNNNLTLYNGKAIDDTTFFNETFLNNQTLLGKDYYVILRPAINYTCK